MKAPYRLLFSVIPAIAGERAIAETPGPSPRGGFDYAVTPAALAFHGAIGVPTPTRTITVAAATGNGGNVVLTGCSFGGAQSGDYSMAPAPTFPLSVAPGASVNLPIRFTAGTLGPRNASFICQTSNGMAVGGSFPISLNGTGVVNTLATTPALAFPTTSPGSTSAPLSVLAGAGASNTGNVTITACKVGGAHPADFSQVPAVTNAVVAPGASIVIPVRFSPAVVGARSATLTCNVVNGPTASFDVALGGTSAKPPAQTQSTTRVSVSTAGGQGNGGSSAGALSADGRFVVFSSGASNLVVGDGNGTVDAFAHDRLTAQTQRVSVSSAGSAGFGNSSGGAISADGRFVAFTSAVSTLVAGDSNGVPDVFVHDCHSGQTQRVSVSNGGAQVHDSSHGPSLSADGRYVGFGSFASDLVPGDGNNAGDFFIHDRQTGLTQRVSVPNAGGEANADSNFGSLSADGRFAVFTSVADNLVAGDSNGSYDVFVRDLQAGQTRRVSVSSAGGQANDSSEAIAVSSDGRHVAFSSWASNLVPGDNNGMRDVFIHDRSTAQTHRVSVATGGAQANGLSDQPSLSADGRHVAFVSDASNLVSGDGNGATDVFVHDRQTGQTRRTSVATDGSEGNFESRVPILSADGRHVAFQSAANNLVPGDTNGTSDVFVNGPDDSAAFDRIFADGFDGPVD